MRNHDHSLPEGTRQIKGIPNKLYIHDTDVTTDLIKNTNNCSLISAKPNSNPTKKIKNIYFDDNRYFPVSKPISIIKDTLMLCIQSHTIINLKKKKKMETQLL